MHRTEVALSPGGVSLRHSAAICIRVGEVGIIRRTPVRLSVGRRALKRMCRCLANLPHLLRWVLVRGFRGLIWPRRVMQWQLQVRAVLFFWDRCCVRTALRFSRRSRLQRLRVSGLRHKSGLSTIPVLTHGRHPLIYGPRSP